MEVRPNYNKRLVYKVISAIGIERFDELCNQMASEGWQPSSNLVVTPIERNVVDPNDYCQQWVTLVTIENKEKDSSFQVVSV